MTQEIFQVFGSIVLRLFRIIRDMHVSINQSRHHVHSRQILHVTNNPIPYILTHGLNYPIFHNYIHPPVNIPLNDIYHIYILQNNGFLLRISFDMQQQEYTYNTKYHSHAPSCFMIS